MKKYFIILIVLGIFSSCSKKNDPVPQMRAISAVIEAGINSVLTITETVNGKTTQVYHGDGDNPYKFSAPVGASITIIADALSDGFEAPDLAVTDNGTGVGNIQASLDAQMNMHSQVTFIVK